MEQNICRICLSISKKAVSIFSEKTVWDTKFKLSDMIMACAPVKIKTNDKLPEKICDTCCKHLQASFIFRLRTLRADGILRNYNAANVNTPEKLTSTTSSVISVDERAEKSYKTLESLIMFPDGCEHVVDKLLETPSQKEEEIVKKLHKNFAKPVVAFGNNGGNDTERGVNVNNSMVAAPVVLREIEEIQDDVSVSESVVRGPSSTTNQPNITGACVQTNELNSMYILVQLTRNDANAHARIMATFSSAESYSTYTAASNSLPVTTSTNIKTIHLDGLISSAKAEQPKSSPKIDSKNSEIHKNDTFIDLTELEAPSTSASGAKSKKVRCYVNRKVTQNTDLTTASLHKRSRLQITPERTVTSTSIYSGLYVID